MSADDDNALCECVVKGEHDEDDDECPARITLEDGTRLMCTRPDGHEGPHSACNVQEHPITVWEGDA